MKVFFVNPPFKSQYGKFSREQRSPSITKSGCFYYPLWLIYSAARLEKNGYDVKFIDAPAKQVTPEKCLEYIKNEGEGTKLFVIDTTTPSIYNDVEFAEKIHDSFPESVILTVGTHVSVRAEETLRLSNKISAVARREHDLIVNEVADCIRDNNDWHNVKGLSYFDDDGNLIENENMPYITDMDSVPFASEFIKKHLDVKDYFIPAAYYPEI